MAYCRNCGQNLDEHANFCPGCGTPVNGSTSDTVQPQAQPTTPQRERPSTHLVKSILTLLFCCLPFGIVALVFSCKVDSHWVAGRYDEAYRASNLANKWGNAALICGIVQYVFYVIYIVAVGGIAVIMDTIVHC